MWDVACALYHALCQVRGTRVLCRCRVCRMHPRACPSTGWALNRCLAWTFGTAAVGEVGGLMIDWQ